MSRESPASPLRSSCQRSQLHASKAGRALSRSRRWAGASRTRAVRPRSPQHLVRHAAADPACRVHVPRCTAVRCAGRETRSLPKCVSAQGLPAPHVSPHVIGEKSKSLADLSARVQKVAGVGRNYCKARKAIGQRGQDFCAAPTARAQFPAGFALEFSLLTCSLKLIVFAFAASLCTAFT